MSASNWTGDLPVAEVTEFFGVVVRQIHAQTVEHWVGLDLTMAQLKVLVTLDHAGSATIGQVAESLGVSMPTASHLVDRLEQAGFAERSEDPADRRRTLASLSPAGSALVTSLRQGGRDQLVRWLGQLEREEFEALHRGLRALASAARAASTDTTLNAKLFERGTER